LVEVIYPDASDLLGVFRSLSATESCSNFIQFPSATSGEIKPEYFYQETP
jgi:hypothetical protein